MRSRFTMPWPNARRFLKQMGDETLKELAMELTAKLSAEHDGGLAGARQRPRAACGC